MSDHDLLCTLETAMWTAETRGDRSWMEAHLSPAFVEFGQSGRSYTRAEILDLPTGDSTIDVILPLRDLAVRDLAPGVALVTYRSVRAGRHAHRSSIWARHGGRWLLEFHQGTPTVASP